IRDPLVTGVQTCALPIYGVYLSMLACAEEVWHEHSLSERRVAVQGAGKVGYPLVKLLVQGGAHVIVSDVDVDALARVVRDFSVRSEERRVGKECRVGGAG